MGMQAEQQKQGPVTINYGVIKANEDGQFYVLLQFSAGITHIILNDAQVDAMLASLQDVKTKLIAHRQGATKL